MSNRELRRQNQNDDLGFTGETRRALQPTRTRSGVNPPWDAPYARFFLRSKPDRRASVSETYKGPDRRLRT